jgi:hypothetical protein
MYPLLTCILLLLLTRHTHTHTHTHEQLQLIKSGVYCAETGNDSFFFLKKRVLFIACLLLIQSGLYCAETGNERRTRANVD